MHGTINTINTALRAVLTSKEGATALGGNTTLFGMSDFLNGFF